jgi:tripartite-type tricarboxylate transporter receptor subunit TctC
MTIITRRGVLATTLSATVATGLARPALAQGFSGRPITLVVPWAPGGGTDVVARAVAPLLSERLGATVTVFNRPGGNGVVGHMAVRSAPPDGTTVGLIVPNLLTAPLFAPSPLTWQDLQPIALLNVDPGAITVARNAPWRDLAALAAHARSNPEAVRVANSGAGGTWHLVALELERSAGVKFTHVVYAGAAPGLQDLVAGNIEATAFSAVEARGQVEGGAVRILAVTAKSRLPAFPDAPTAIEQGFDIDVVTWRGLAAPPGTPEAVLARWRDAVRAAATDPRFVSFMAQQSFGIRYLDTADFTALIREEDARYRRYFQG